MITTEKLTIMHGLVCFGGENMKSIGIVTDRKSRLSRFLKNNLESIFKGFSTINTYCMDELREGVEIRDDAVLFMIKENALEYEKYVLHKENVIVVERTLKEKDIYRLFTLPKNARVLVVNDSKETTLETVSMLHQIGISNLELIAFDSSKTYDDIKVAITPAEEEYVPNYIDTVINVGNRYIDTTTLIKIANKLGLEDKSLSERIINYSETIINLNNGVKEKYRDLFVKSEELDTIINSSKEGFLLIDNEEKISFCNRAFQGIFSIDGSVSGRGISEVLSREVVKMFRKPSIKDDILEIPGKYINVNKQTVKSLGQNIGFCFNIQEVTYIKQLEQNLSRKLKNKGLIAKYNFGDMHTESKHMEECIDLARKISCSDLTVLITGESGTGKEVMAQSIHNASNRKKQPFVAINCAALPESLLESELFGYEGGAFTGALREGKIGLFEQANNGTIFLDEIGDMPISLQTRMLRVIQERQVMRIGSQSVVDINVRIIAATHRDLMKMIEEGRFREDLFYRLNVLPVNIPPLRERREDILMFMKSCLDGGKKLELSEEVSELLLNYSWPGNIRELKNVADYVSLMSDGVAGLKDVPHYMFRAGNDYSSEFEYLKGKCSINNLMEIIRIIEEKKTCKSGAGRKSIEEALQKRNVRVTEAEVRRILELMNETGMVTSSVGRRGSEITFKGISFANWMENRMK
jgi:transcriptional regulator with PAS, ATPase and Fis domain